MAEASSALGSIRGIGGGVAIARRASGVPAGGVRGAPVAVRAMAGDVTLGEPAAVPPASIGAFAAASAVAVRATAIGAAASAVAARASAIGGLAAVPVAVRATAIGVASAAASAASRAVCSILNTTMLSFVSRFTARRTPGRPNRLTGVAHASTTVHRPRSTGVLSSSWIENAVSSPTGRSASVDTKNVESSQKR